MRANKNIWMKESQAKDKLNNLKFALDRNGRRNDGIEIWLSSFCEKEDDNFILYVKPHIMNLAKKYNVTIKECGIDEIRCIS